MKFSFYFCFGQIWFFCSFENKKVSHFQNPNIILIGSLTVNLYLLDTIVFYNETLQTQFYRTKCKLTDENFAIL